MPGARHIKPLRIVFLGDAEVGKTSVIHQFLYGVFTERTSPTLGKSFYETIQLPNGKNKMVEILDTSGSQEFPAMREMYIQQGDHFVVVYSVDSQKSFITAQNICNEIRAIKGKMFQSIILVGNKLDMGLSRTVSTERAFKLAALEENIWFLETSAYLNLNVNNVFRTILQKERDNILNCSEEKNFFRSFSDSDFSFKKRTPSFYRTCSDTICTTKSACKSAYLLTK